MLRQVHARTAEKSLGTLRWGPMADIIWLALRTLCSLEKPWMATLVQTNYVYNIYIYTHTHTFFCYFNSDKWLGSRSSYPSPKVSGYVYIQPNQLSFRVQGIQEGQLIVQSKIIKRQIRSDKTVIYCMEVGSSCTSKRKVKERDVIFP